MYPLGTPYLMWVGMHPFLIYQCRFLPGPIMSKCGQWVTIYWFVQIPMKDQTVGIWNYITYQVHCFHHRNSDNSWLTKSTNWGIWKKKNLLMHILRDEKINITFDITYFLKKCVMNLILFQKSMRFFQNVSDVSHIFWKKFERHLVYVPISSEICHTSSMRFP